MTALYPELASHPEAEVDVLGIGNAIVDVLAGADDAFLEAEGLVKGTMHLVDQERADLLYSRMGPGNETSGGSAANTATGVVACGGSAAFIGTVADDQLGEIFAHDIRAAGVRYRTNPIDASEGTARCMILVTPEGERTMNTFLGAASSVSFDHVDPAWLEGATITYLEGYLFDSKQAVVDWRKAMDVAHGAGRLIALTLSDPFCVERHRDEFLDLLSGGSIDICFGNEEELCSLYQTTDLEMALTEVSKVCHIAAITRGERGSILLSGDTRVEVPAEPVNVVDTTGAGDLYAAGVMAGLTRGWSLERSGRLGSRAAAAVVCRMGARLSSETLPLPD